MSGNETKTMNLKKRLDFLGLGPEQLKVVSDSSATIVASLDHALDTFYAKAKLEPETARFFANDAHIAHAKAHQKKHWATIASGRFDAGYVDAVTTIGRTHARLGLEPRWYIGGYALILEQIIKAVIGSELKGMFMDAKAKRLSSSLSAIFKSAMLDMDYSISVYLEVLAAERLVAEQKREKLEAEQEEALSALDSALHRLAAGDLTSTIHQPLAEQFTDLKTNYNRSVAHLETTFSDIIVAAGQIASDSRELTGSSDDMAKRTEQQAASLEQTAAALEEITTISKLAADRTRDVQMVVRTSSEEATRSGEVVGQAVEAMNAIEQSSQKITKIISVIDEIAFQTNLLALNAGVEAARAGEAGRGFAVVAQEVRELAQRSANAAKEIKTLIGKSFEDVVLGVSLVNKTGEALTTIGQQVHSINEHINAIASSAQEQAAGVNEINSAVTNMDQATQRNATMVVQTNASTHNLMEASNTLARLVSAFTVSSTARYQDKSANYQRRYA